MKNAHKARGPQRTAGCTPAETILPTETYQNSPRFFDDMTRLLTGATRSTDWLAQSNACLFALTTNAP